MKDIGILDYPPNYITDVVEYRNFRFVLIRESYNYKNKNYKSWNYISWKPRNELDIVRIHHSSDNIATARCPFCGLGRGFRCENKNSEESKDFFYRTLRTRRISQFPKDLTE